MHLTCGKYGANKQNNCQNMHQNAQINAKYAQLHFFYISVYL